MDEELKLVDFRKVKFEGVIIELADDEETSETYAKCAWCGEWIPLSDGVVILGYGFVDDCCLQGIESHEGHQKTCEFDEFDGEEVE